MPGMCYNTNRQCRHSVIGMWDADGTRRRGNGAEGDAQETDGMGKPFASTASGSFFRTAESGFQP